MTTLYLGVDGGQSHTRALLANESGSILATGESGPCRDTASLHSALQQAGALATPIESACFGLSGGTENQESELRHLVHSSHYVFTNDADVALTGALAAEPGVIVIAGTGSIAFARNPAGKTARAGGWGYAFGDEGGAFDLTRHALRAVLRHEEGWGPPTALRHLLLEATGSATANDLMHRFYTGSLPRVQFAALAPLVDQAASTGDNLAQEILKSAAQTLATFAASVRSQLFQSNETVSIAYSGGVFRSPTILARFRMLIELDDANRVAPPRYGPAAGALLQAFRAANKTCTLKNVPEET